MACAHPLKIHPQYQVGSHFVSSPKDYEVPCGYCVCCRRDKQNYICDRAEYEYCKRLTASFVTFTYNDIYLIDRCAVLNPEGGFIYDEDNKIRTSLNYKDLTDFLQNIRKTVKYHKEWHGILCQPDFSYIYCGEYGDCFGRCHFHVLFFGLDFAFCKKLIFENWKYGFIDVLPLLDGGIRYVTKYMDKMEKGELAFLKYDCRGIARPKLRMSAGFGQDLLWDNVKDIVENEYTYKIAKGKRRPISAYWKNLLTGYKVCRDVTRKNLFEKTDYHEIINALRTKQSMIERNLHRKVNVNSEFERRKFRLQLATLREKNIIKQMHDEHIPVQDYDTLIKSKFGFVTYDGRVIRKLPSERQRLLAEEYRYSLEQDWLYKKFG